MSVPSVRLNANAREFVLPSSSNTQQPQKAKKIEQIVSASQKFPSMEVTQEKKHKQATDITHAQNSAARSIPFKESIPSSALTATSSSATITTTSTTTTPQVNPSQTTAAANIYTSTSTKVSKPTVFDNVFQPEDANSHLYWIIHDQGRPFALKCIKKDVLPSFRFWGDIDEQRIMDLKKQLTTPSNLYIYRCSFENGCDALLADIIATSPFINKLLIRESHFLAPIKISPHIRELIIDAYQCPMTSFPDISEAKSLLFYEVIGKSGWDRNDFNDKIDIPPGCPLETLHMDIIYSTPNLKNAIHLKRLEVNRCDFSGFTLETNTELEVVQFLGCDKTNQLPSFCYLPKLQALGLFNLDNLKIPPQVPEQITTLIIQNCPRLQNPPELSHVAQFERLIQDQVPYYSAESRSKHRIAQNIVKKVDNTAIYSTSSSTTSSIMSSSMNLTRIDENDDDNEKAVEVIEAVEPEDAKEDLFNIFDDQEDVKKAVETFFNSFGDQEYVNEVVEVKGTEEAKKAISTKTSYSQMASKSLSTTSSSGESNRGGGRGASPNATSRGRGANSTRGSGRASHPSNNNQSSQVNSSGGAKRGGRGANPNASTQGRGANPTRGGGRASHSSGNNHGSQTSSLGRSKGRGRGANPNASSRKS